MLAVVFVLATTKATLRHDARHIWVYLCRALHKLWRVYLCTCGPVNTAMHALSLLVICAGVPVTVYLFGSVMASAFTTASSRSIITGMPPEGSECLSPVREPVTISSCRWRFSCDSGNIGKCGHAHRNSKRNTGRPSPFSECFFYRQCAIN